MPPLYSKEWKNPIVQLSGEFRQMRTSPCEDACPIGNNIQKVHTLLEQGRVDDALECLHAKNPFPGITGRVCPHPCESACNRCGYDEGLAIHHLERYAADRGHARTVQPLPPSGRHVAVVGAGPAGLTAARLLRLLGHEVTVYESSPVMGGVPRQAIPDFRLPKDVVDRETGAIVAIGVRVHTNVAVGRDVSLQSLLDKYDACVLATGMWKERLLAIPGKEYLRPAVSWLRSTTLERDSLSGRSVAVLGGGGVAFDCAFTARRLGAAEVHLLCLEGPEELRAPADEIAQARAEGIVFHTSVLSSAVEQTEDGAFQVQARPVRSFSFDAAGELHVEPAETAPCLVRADLVICASGLQTDPLPLSGVDVVLTPRGCVQADAEGRTSLPGLFATGEIACGPALISTAVGLGRRTAIGVHKMLCGLKETDNLDIWIEDGSLCTQVRPALEQPHVVALDEIMHVDYHPHAARIADRPAADTGPALPFSELLSGPDEDEAAREAGRCLHCGHCMECGSCVESCPGHILVMDDDGPQVAYPEQCWHCGCCRIACPTGSIAYRFPLTMML